jgi:hypothetical protein
MAAAQRLRAAWAGLEVLSLRNRRKRSARALARYVDQVAADDVVTDRRAVFMGSRKTLEFAFTKLVGLDVMSDAVRLHATDRQDASLLRLQSGRVTAAYLNAAAQGQ